jgi:DNA processing protein
MMQLSRDGYVTFPKPPPVLFVSGDPQYLADPQIAVVGSRRPTPEGGKNAHGFAGQLSRVSLFIASGLAAGIDGAG